MEENPFFSIEQSNITNIPALQKLDNRAPEKFMAILWNPSSHSISIKKNTTILVEAWHSLEQYIGLKEDKLSSTTVDFIRSEGEPGN